MRSGGPVSAGYDLVTERSTTRCDVYRPTMCPGEDGHRASIWEKSGDTKGTYALRHVALNMPVWTRQTDPRPTSWAIWTGQWVKR